MIKHIHQMDTVNLVHLTPCRVCGITEDELTRIYDDQRAGNDGTHRNTEQAAKPANPIPQRER